MRTVKEVSNLISISVHTLHYYEEIGLLKPSILSAVEYRFYDYKALEILQHILFLCEYVLSLKQIKFILGKTEFIGRLSCEVTAWYTI